MSSTDDVSISTGNPVLDSFFASLMSFMKNLADRLDVLAAEHNLLSEEVGKRNEAVDSGCAFYPFGVYPILIQIAVVCF